MWRSWGERVKTSKLTMLGLCAALAMIFSFVESQIPPIVPLAGVKVGLPNIAIVFVLYRVGVKEAYAVNLVRIVLTSLLFGMSHLPYALVGGMLSLTVMALMRRFTQFSSVSVSVTGGVFHNIGQVAVAYFITNTAQLFTYYLPVLLVSGTVAGVVIGVVAGIAVKRLEKWDLR